MMSRRRPAAEGPRLTSRSLQICLALFVVVWFVTDWAWTRRHIDPATGLDAHLPAGGQRQRDRPAPVEQHEEQQVEQQAERQAEQQQHSEVDVVGDVAERERLNRAELVANVREREQQNRLERARLRERERLRWQERLKAMLATQSEGKRRDDEQRRIVEALQRLDSEEREDRQRVEDAQQQADDEEQQDAEEQHQRQFLAEKQARIEEQRRREEQRQRQDADQFAQRQQHIAQQLDQQKASERSVRPPLPVADLQEKNACGKWNGRNYDLYPVWSDVRTESAEVLADCDVPCVWSPQEPPRRHGVPADVTMHPRCELDQRFEQSMEAIYAGRSYNRPGVIQSFPDLLSDVPAPYFSWVEYGFMERLQPKQAKSMVAAFISNCGARKRLSYLERLMKAGVTVDSFGNCLNNKRSEASGKGDWFKSKVEELKRYKFAIAFENTELRDYVTEKLFMAFIAGAVPIHMGIEDVHKFGPSNRSIISVHDFDSPEQLAKYLLYLDANPDEYEKYLDWKWKGYSPEFQAMIDLAARHSACRTCIEAADRVRFAVGDPHPSVRPFPEDDPDAVHYTDEIYVKIRPRNNFWFRRMWLPAAGLDLDGLIAATVRLFDIAPPRQLFAIQTRARPHIVLNTNELVRRHVTEGVELEAIIIDRPDFSYLQKWYPERF